MFTRTRFPLALIMVLAGCFIPLSAVRGGDSADSNKPTHFKGKVVPLADLVEKIGSHLDPDAAPHWLALVADDGKVYPLIKDEGSRMFFSDHRLLNRPMRLTARPLPGSQMLQVLEVHSYLHGELHEVYYWCEVCSIRRLENKKCDCCGGPMELKMIPVPADARK